MTRDHLMEEFLRELKRAREAKGIPLAQISDITRIAEEHLMAIEEGKIDLLPAPYVRAFLREYAEVVGLSPDEMMRKYDIALAGAAHRSRLAPAPPSPHGSVPSPSPSTTAPAAPGTFLTASNARIALTIVVVAALAIVAWNLAGPKTEPVTEEIPFQTVLKQEEQRLAPARTETPAVVPVTPHQRPIAAGDSLVLHAVTTDSIWIAIQIDDQPVREYLFRSGARPSWKGATRFVLTLGNAGAAEFTLNDVSLGPLGKRGAVVRSVELNRQNLSRP